MTLSSIWLLEQDDMEKLCVIVLYNLRDSMKETMNQVVEKPWWKHFTDGILKRVSLFYRYTLCKRFIGVVGEVKGL
jgi:hypothetical protein